MKGQGRPRVVKTVRPQPVKQKVAQKPYKPASGGVRG